jgi:hypothetical protein
VVFSGYSGSSINKTEIFLKVVLITIALTYTKQFVYDGMKV